MTGPMTADGLRMADDRSGNSGRSLMMDPEQLEGQELDGIRENAVSVATRQRGKTTPPTPPPGKFGNQKTRR